MSDSLILSNTGSVKGISSAVTIHVPSDAWLGKVGDDDDEYVLVTPHNYAYSQMMSLQAVKQLIENRELPHVCFTKQTYVVVKARKDRKPCSQEGPIWAS